MTDKCPVCGKTEFKDYYETCPHCGWVHDLVQEDEESFNGGPNGGYSLKEYRDWYEKEGFKGGWLYK